MDTDTICAVATPNGLGGVGVVRLSGGASWQIVEKLTGRSFEPRRATLANFNDSDGDLIDQGLVLLFESGRSYTGEQSAELQGHGSPVALQRLVDACLGLGARLARSGEFTERSFVQGNIDLAQAEAVADLIASGSVAAAKGAARSLVGAFSDRVASVASALLDLRVYVEADIDFPDEEVDVLADGEVTRRLEALAAEVHELLEAAHQGVRLTQGAEIAIVGAPNAGKSSLLNALSGEDAAIVTDIAGTTRDLLKVDLVLGGVPVRLVDTAGLRNAEDVVEEEGVRRALRAMTQADAVIYLRDLARPDDGVPSEWLAGVERVLEVWNKADLVENPPDGSVSAKTGAGLQLLVDRVLNAIGFQLEAAPFTARVRHVEALRRVASSLARAKEGTQSELIAEELRVAHQDLGEIVGEVTSDALLGKIFSTFCIGK